MTSDWYLSDHDECKKKSTFNQTDQKSTLFPFIYIGVHCEFCVSKTSHLGVWSVLASWHLKQLKNVFLAYFCNTYLINDMFLFQTCPLLLRVFNNIGRHNAMSEYHRGQTPANELQIYTW